MNNDIIAQRKLNKSVDGEFVLGENLFRHDEEILIKKMKEFGEEKMNRKVETYADRSAIRDEKFLFCPFCGKALR